MNYKTLSLNHRLQYGPDVQERASIYGRQSSGKAKSITEQLQAGHAAINDNGWVHAGDYKDGVAASRFGTKTRSDWNRLIADLEADSFDVLVLWESSRGDRTLSSWATFLEKCRDHRVRIHVIADDHTYNLDRPRDWKTLANAGVDAAAETDLLSIRVKRGHAGAAQAGLPGGGPTPFGYRRLYDQHTGKRREQIPDDAQAPVVREIFKKIAEGHTVLGLAAELTARGVPRPSSLPWDRSTIRRIVANPVYIGRRILNGVEHQGEWEPIVDEALWRAARAVLAQPERRITRPGRQKHLLSYLGRCGACDGFLNQVAGCYRCAKAGCVSIPMGVTDSVVTEAVLHRLANPEFIAARTVDDDAEAEQARVDAQKLRDQLSEWRMSAVRGETSPGSLAVIEAELTSRIEEADTKSRTIGVSPLVLSMLNPGVDIRERWEGMTVIARRKLVDALCEVKVAHGFQGRRPRGADLVRMTYERLGQSRWRQDELTWADYTLR